MDTIKINKSVFLIPPTPPKLQVRCDKDWGQFILDMPRGTSILDAQKNGYIKGTHQEFVLATVRQRDFTIDDNYINVPFAEIWAIPVKGGLKEVYSSPNASSLFSFIMHKRSKDNFTALASQFSQKAFDEWVKDGCQGEFNGMGTVYQHVFLCDFERVSGARGDYWALTWGFRNPESDFEKNAIEAAALIREGVESGVNAHWCFNEAYERWAANALESKRQALPPISEQEARASITPSVPQQALPSANGKRK